MKKTVSEFVINERIALNRKRLSESYYDIDNVFIKEAGWPGDKEGRALLAFVCHFKMNGVKIPCMDKMIDKIPEVTENRMFFGSPSGEVLFEQQLSGHSWYLRGLCEYYEQFADDRVIKYLNETFDKLYRPTMGRFSTYPIERTDISGGVGGHSCEEINGWKLSTDIGCAFMSIDGLSHYYKVTKNPDAKLLLEEMADCFDKIDKYNLEAQTHCTLTAARGLMRMYEITNDVCWLEKAEKIFLLYIEKGMTYTYQNFNWFKKGDTWTEPCAIVDSLMLAGMLYKATAKESYRTYAARIYFNGLASAQRPNGGAGTDTTVSDTTNELKAKMYEAPFCCSMRLAEGLLFVKENADMLYAEVSGEIKKDSHGRYMDGDLIYAEIQPEFEKYAEEPKFVDGHKLFPLISYYKLKDEKECAKVVQKVIF